MPCTPGLAAQRLQGHLLPDTGIWAKTATTTTSAGNNPANWTDGKLYDLNRLNKSSTQVVGFYVGGPLVKRSPVLYANAEQTRTASEGSRVVGNPDRQDRQLARRRSAPPTARRPGA